MPKTPDYNFVLILEEYVTWHNFKIKKSNWGQLFTLFVKVKISQAVFLIRVVFVELKEIWGTYMSLKA